jgi:hypothetical protein
MCVLLQPGGEEALDVAAAARPLEAPRDGTPLHDDQGRHRLDLEVLQQVRALLLRDADDLERPVVAPSLQHLGKEPLHTSTMSGQCRVEEDQPGLLLL